MKFENWDICGFERDAAVEFYREGLNPLVCVFLASRGIASIDDARVMVGEVPGEIYDPFLLADIEQAVERIHSAIKNGERITIYGDYDVDGMTSSTVIATWLRSKNAEFDVYIPDRLNEGYCLNNAALDELKSRGTSLIITVDCGVTAIEEAAYAKSIGLDLVITDHHECRTALPEAIAVIDPKRHDCDYPNKDLAGVGVAFKLVCALESDSDLDQVISNYCDLVAIGTISDVMPIHGENRELIRRGLQILNNAPRPGVLSLLTQASAASSRTTAMTISYTLAPRLNAAGRMGQADLSIQLLLADAGNEAEDLASELCRLNAERRDCESSIYEEVIAMLPGVAPSHPIIIAKKGWHQGVTGIVASKVADRYRKPTIIISIDENGVGRGTCRSFGKFKIYQAISGCDDLLNDYGGHEAAAGITIIEENIDEFRSRIIEHYKTRYESDADLKLRLDFEVEKPELLTVQNIEALTLLEPFGNNNPYPCLCIKNALLSSLRSIGDGKHTRLRIDKAGASFDCIYFSMVSSELGIEEGDLVDIAFEPQINEFKGRISVQLNVLDIRKSE